jgi:hypothetical protein
MKELWLGSVTARQYFYRVNALGVWISHGSQMKHGFISVDTWTQKTHSVSVGKSMCNPWGTIAVSPQEVACGVPCHEPQLSGLFSLITTVNTEDDLTIFSALVNQLTDKSLTIDHFQQYEGRLCTLNASMRKLEKLFLETGFSLKKKKNSGRRGPHI